MGVRIVDEPGGVVSYYRNNYVVAHTWRTDRGDHFWEVLTERTRGHSPNGAEAHAKIFDRLGLVPVSMDDRASLLRGLRNAAIADVIILAVGYLIYRLMF